DRVPWVDLPGHRLYRHGPQPVVYDLRVRPGDDAEAVGGTLEVLPFLHVLPCLGLFRTRRPPDGHLRHRGASSRLLPSPPVHLPTLGWLCPAMAPAPRKPG